MSLPNINELLDDAVEEVRRQAQYRVVRYLQNQYLHTEGIDNDYSRALEIIYSQQEAERKAQ
jgi:hypothetical protein